MSYDVFSALLLFAFVSSITPGPNNIMLLASGVNFGFRRTIPHMLGIGAGFVVLLLAVGLGLGAVLTAFPALHTALKIAGGAYLLYLAWRVATSRTLAREGGEAARPMRFSEAAAFQWVNPKGWTMALTGITAYAPGQSLWAVLVVSGAFLVVNSVSGSLWVLIGQQIRRFLTDPRRLVLFNWTMAALLVATLIPVLIV